MERLSRRSFLGASLGLAAAATASSESAGPQPGQAGRSEETEPRLGAIIKTRLGQVRGLDRGRVKVFLGMRYGKPPVGALRFAPPELAEPWTGVHEAIHLPPIAVQMPSPPLVASVISGSQPLQGRQSEDCLFLNIYTPATDGRKRPVLVWIHGGGYTVGSANEYDGGVLAAQGDAVVVCINYRLGVFGFTDLSGLDKSLAGSASNGFRDQIAALKWVRDNITDYGGDPGNVTIFGESAGGGSVLALLAAPSAEGLFHRASAHSPGGALVPPPDDLPKLAAALKVSGANLLKQLRAMSAQELLALQQSASLNCSGCIDGVVITRPYAKAIRERGAAGVPLIAGSMRDEGTLMRELGWIGDDFALAMASGTMEGADPTAYLAALRAAHPQADAVELDVLVWTDFFRRACVRATQAATEAGRGGWLYRFDLPSSALGGKLGATHGTDIPYIFNMIPGGAGIPDGRDPAVRKVAQQWSNTILAFARTGDPNGAGLPAWPKYSNRERASLVIDANSRIAHGLDDAHRKLWGDA